MVLMKPPFDPVKLFARWAPSMFVTERLELSTCVVEGAVQYDAPRQPHLIAEFADGRSVSFPEPNVSPIKVPLRWPSPLLVVERLDLLTCTCEGSTEHGVGKAPG